MIERNEINEQKLFQPSEERTKRKEEERKYGVFFDDDYDYLQHLRDSSDASDVHWEYIPPANLKTKSTEKKPSKQSGGKLNLPSSVFASEFEEDEGLLLKAAPHSGPRPDLNVDVLAALDEDFDFENPDNQLEDNFMELAMGDGGDDDGDEQDFSSDFSDDEDDDDEWLDEENDGLAPLRSERRMRTFSGEETKSKFTEYSMSSSVIRRNEQLTLLDDRFEKFYDNYDEPEIGALDCEEIEGHIDLDGELFAQCQEEMDNTKCEIKYDRKWDDRRIKKIMEEESSEDEMIEVEVSDDGDEKKWDCESILSTYSNRYNHPKVISEPRRQRSKIVINSKTGLPENVFNGENKLLTEKSLGKFNTENT